MMNAEPQKEHRWLAGLVGEWAHESEPCATPGQEPMKFSGSESVRALGGLWIVGQGQGIAATAAVAPLGGFSAVHQAIGD